MAQEIVEPDIYKNLIKRSIFDASYEIEIRPPCSAL